MQHLFLILSLAFSSTLQAKQYDINIKAESKSNFGTCVLPARITIPDKAKAVVIIIHGSGPHDFDGTAPGGYTIYKDIAESLERQGIAAVRYTKRSAIKNCAEKINHPDFTHDVFIDDMRSIIRLVKIHSTLKSLPIFLLGHSQGVSFATVVAKDDVRIKGLVLMAGLGRFPISTTLVRQLKAALETPGLTKNQMFHIRANYRKAKRFFKKLKQRKIKKEKFFMGAYRDFWIEQEKLTYNTAKIASQVRVPSLVIQGAADANVTKADFQTLVKATKKIKGSSNEYYPRVNHLFTEGNSKRVSATVMSRIGKWILSQIRIPDSKK